MNSKTLIAIGGLGLAALLPLAASAHTDVSIGLNLGGYPVYAAPAPVYYTPPQPVYYAPPQPVYYSPAPVYYGGNVSYYDGGRRWCRDGHRGHEWREHEWHEHGGRRW